jgi:SAM-dependent methyltransferase
MLNHDASALKDRHFVNRGTGSEFEMEVDWVRRALGAASSPVADVGCGIGGLFPTLETRHPIGVDYLLEGLLETRRRHPWVPLVCADGGKLPFRDATLTAVTAQHVLEHIADADGLLREWRRVLRPGGRLVILTPNRLFSDPTVYDDDTHVKIYDPADLRMLFHRTGFDVVDIRTLGLDWCRHYKRFPGGWRVRRLVLGYARLLSRVPGLAGRGQTLCGLAAVPPSREALP